jgi:hypothetical protein
MFLLFITLVPSRYCKLLSPINTPLTVADENQDNGSRGSVSSSVIGVFTEKGKLVLTDGKLSAKGQKGGQATLQLYVDPGSSERMLKSDARDFQGFTYSAELKRTGESASAK